MMSEMQKMIDEAYRRYGSPEYAKILKGYLDSIVFEQGEKPTLKGFIVWLDEKENAVSLSNYGHLHPMINDNVDDQCYELTLMEYSKRDGGAPCHWLYDEWWCLKDVGKMNEAQALKYTETACGMADDFKTALIMAYEKLLTKFPDSTAVHGAGCPPTEMVDICFAIAKKRVQTKMAEAKKRNIHGRG